MYLYVSLWLHESSHDSKAGVEMSIGGVSGHAGYDGVVRTLPWGEAVGVARVKGEVSTSVLYRHCTTKIHRYKTAHDNHENYVSS